MTINRRRAPSSKVSSDKKLGGHQREGDYATLIGGKVINGTQKGDVKDKIGNLHSVKSGKKWQVFLYGYERICESRYLNILRPCLDAFPKDFNQYVKDRTKCISFKEGYVKNHGKDATRRLSNEVVIKQLGANAYVESKNQLAKTTISTCSALKNKDFLHKFLDEALFNSGEVEFLAIKDDTYKKDGLFKIFAREDVLDILSSELFPSISIAGRVPEDYNVAGQKTLLCYMKTPVRAKNIVEIEIRNDSRIHYRQVRFNMYSEDTLSLLIDRAQPLPIKYFHENVVVYGKATLLLKNLLEYK